MICARKELTGDYCIIPAHRTEEILKSEDGDAKKWKGHKDSDKTKMKKMKRMPDIANPSQTHFTHLLMWRLPMRKPSHGHIGSAVICGTLLQVVKGSQGSQHHIIHTSSISCCPKRVQSSAVQSSNVAAAHGWKTGKLPLKLQRL